MSRISKDSTFDVSNLSTLSVIPRRSIVNLTPVQGAIVYDLSSNSLAVSDGITWSQVGSGNEIAGFPISNPPGPLPNGGITIFNNTTNEWTVYSLGGDVSLDNAGSVTVNGISGTPVGPFPGLAPGDVLTWNGTTWVNSPAGPGGPPSGPAGGDLAGLYPNPTLAVIGAATGPIGNGTTVPVVTTDAKGRVTALTSTAIAFPPSTSQVSGTPIGPFPGISAGDSLTWNGSAWVNVQYGGILTNWSNQMGPVLLGPNTLSADFRTSSICQQTLTQVYAGTVIVPPGTLRVLNVFYLSVILRTVPAGPFLINFTTEVQDIFANSPVDINKIDLTSENTNLCETFLVGVGTIDGTVIYLQVEGSTILNPSLRLSWTGTVPAGAVAQEYDFNSTTLVSPWPRI
jgi:hypothetical protein